MALALNNLQRVDMPLNNQTKTNHRWRKKSYPSAEMQSMDFIAPADWAVYDAALCHHQEISFSFGGLTPLWRIQSAYSKPRRQDVY